MSEKPPANKEIWDPWIQSWRFSIHSEFRIPEYLSSMWRDWHQQSPLLINQTFKPEPFYFFRHPLKNEIGPPEEVWTPFIQFAQSALLTSLLDQGVEIEETSKKVKESISGLKTYLKDNQNDWKDFLEAIQRKKHDYLEAEIDFEHLKMLSDDASQITDEEIPKIFHHLFLAFCNVSHRGYLQQPLNEIHLHLTTKDRDSIIGYCLELSPELDSEKLPEINWIRKLRWDGSTEEILLKDKKQPEAFDILEEPNTENSPFRQLLRQMGSAVNGRPFERPRKTQRLVAVPVYEWSTAATASIHPLADDKPPERVLAERLAKIALHELGHSFGLDHHDYEEEIDCLMVGDAFVDCTETVDSGGIRFCKPCGSAIRKKLRRW